MSFDKDLNHPDIQCGLPEGYVVKLRKSIYGLKQAGHVWWQTLTEQLHNFGFKPCDAEPCLFIYNDSQGNFIKLILHVDDGLVITNNEAALHEIFGGDVARTPRRPLSSPRCD